MRVKFYKVDFDNPFRGIKDYENTINAFCSSIEDDGGKILNIDSKVLNATEIAVTIVYKEREE